MTALTVEQARDLARELSGDLSDVSASVLALAIEHPEVENFLPAEGPSGCRHPRYREVMNYAARRLRDSVARRSEDSPPSVQDYRVPEHVRARCFDCEKEIDKADATLAYRPCSGGNGIAIVCHECREKWWNRRV